MEKISIEEALEKDLNTAVDFEITLAALFSASILIAPRISKLLYYPTIVAALILLSVTLIRQMSLINKFSKRELIIDKTSPVLVISTTYSVLYTALWIGDTVSADTSITPIAVALLITVILPPFWVALYEMFFRDFMLLVSIIAYNQCVGLSPSPFRNWAIRLTKSWLSKSLLETEDQPPATERIRTEKTTDIDEISIENQIAAYLGTGLASLVFTGMIFSPAAAIVYLSSASFLKTTILAALALSLAIATNFIIVIVRFLYARYGRDDFSMSNLRYFLYSIIIYILFGGELLYEKGIFVDSEIVLGLSSFLILSPLVIKIWRGKRTSA